MGPTQKTAARRQLLYLLSLKCPTVSQRLLPELIDDPHKISPVKKQTMGGGLLLPLCFHQFWSQVAV